MAAPLRVGSTSRAGAAGLAEVEQAMPKKPAGRPASDLPPADFRPDPPQPPEHILAAACKDVPAVLFEMVSGTINGIALDGEPLDGQKVVHWCLLLERLKKKGHSVGAVAWAFYRLQQWGMLSVKGEVEKIRHGKAGLIPGALVRSTPALWVWWREGDQQRREESAATGMEPQAWSILQVLATNHRTAMTQDEIGEATTPALSRSSVGRWLKVLRTRGFTSPLESGGESITLAGLSLVREQS